MRIARKGERVEEQGLQEHRGKVGGLVKRGGETQPASDIEQEYEGIREQLNHLEVREQTQRGGEG